MPTITYLVGPPASGKRTVGTALSALTGAMLVDNHRMNDPIFTAYGADGVTPLPDWIWELTRRVYDATLEAATRAPAAVSHIFTNHLGDNRREARYVARLRAIAEARDALFLPVWLTCPEDELLRRVSLPSRAEPRKLRDPDRLRELVRREGVLPAPPDALVLDTSTMPPEEAARRIAARRA